MRDNAGGANEAGDVAVPNERDHCVVNLPYPEWQKSAAFLFVGELLLQGVVVPPPQIDSDVVGISVTDLEQGCSLRQRRIEDAVHVSEVVGVLRRAHAATLVR